MDVKSLYTNILQGLGIQYCLEAMQNFYQGAQMFRFILKDNYFEFDKKYYLQIHGTAMGSLFAPNFANIFMHNCESHLLQTAPGDKIPLVWKRFSDDIFFSVDTWRGSSSQVFGPLQPMFPNNKIHRGTLLGTNKLSGHYRVSQKKVTDLIRASTENLTQINRK